MQKKLLKDVFLLCPPFTQLNTPYPATPYLKGFLQTKGISSFQMDLGIEVILEIFSTKGLQQMFAASEPLSANAQRMYQLRESYQQCIDPVMEFLQGKNPSLARLIVSGGFLPQAARFDADHDWEWAFGSMGFQDKAKHLATLYLEDISDYIKECLDENFGFSRYAERLGRSANNFDEIEQYLQKPLSYIDTITTRIFKLCYERYLSPLVCITVPFPGNLIAALRVAQWLKHHHPNTKIAMGGGFANTELRSVNDPRVFSYFDFICLDDGELPIELLHQKVCLGQNDTPLKRTFCLENNTVVYKNNAPTADYKQAALGTPDYSDLPLHQYISVIEIANPMHSLWSDGRWNKLTMAHGCYWGKCTFCDISLDYIKLYEPLTARLLVDRMEALIDQTHERGFHFVDEAAPPALMRELALEILRRKLVVTWWTNIRFEKNFTADLCILLHASGCIAVSGGLEVASDRLLALIDKGVTVAQVAQVNRNFVEAGIMVHAYFMYGFPSQTIQETIDSLELVRQIFAVGLIHSGFWHQFALTAHSPVGKDPQKYGIVAHPEDISFANNDMAFSDTTGIDHEMFSFGLKKSLYNYMHGMCLDLPLQDWFDFTIPKTQISPHYIEECLAEGPAPLAKDHAKVVWLSAIPQYQEISTKKGPVGLFIFHHNDRSLEIKLECHIAHWWLKTLKSLTIDQPNLRTFADLRQDYLLEHTAFETFWYSNKIQSLREFGLLLL